MYIYINICLKIQLRNVAEKNQIIAHINFKFDSLERNEILMLRLLHFHFVFQL